MHKRRGQLSFLGSIYLSPLRSCFQAYLLFGSNTFYKKSLQVWTFLISIAIKNQCRGLGCTWEGHWRNRWSIFSSTYPRYPAVCSLLNMERIFCPYLTNIDVRAKCSVSFVNDFLSRFHLKWNVSSALHHCLRTPVKWFRSSLCLIILNLTWQQYIFVYKSGKHLL